MVRIAIDMDEVIADFYYKDLQMYNDLYESNLQLSDLNDQYVSEIYPETDKIMKFIRNTKGFFKDLPVIEDAQEVIKELMLTHEVFITSAAMDFPNSFDDKFYWLQDKFPFIEKKNIVFCGNKSIIKADYLIDDHIHHFDGFAGTGLLFTAHHNKQIDFPYRMNNWQDVREFFNQLAE
ncbi:5' nucleotidase, NT5C type [Carnobacterium mobile]|uniref:5' nucleotidase, NT5C type n=1 Tax=Carnobacterium mobile TaxID=2750 RepID=UPI0005565CDA|nr:5'-3'-deoxyribonucleotidase [Carnobacterium mobile]